MPRSTTEAASTPGWRQPKKILAGLLILTLLALAQGPVFIPGRSGGSASSSGAGITVFSGATALSGTLFFPIGGGSLPSATETPANTFAPIAAAVSKFYVNLSAPPGIGVSIQFIWRKNSVNQSLRCTIAGAVAFTCSDTADSFSVVAGDLLDISATVTGGVVAGTPSLVMSALFGTPGSGTLTLVATGCGLAGGPITTAGTIARSDTVNVQAGASYGILTTDCGHTVVLTNASATTIPQAGSAGFVSPYFVDLQCTGAGGCVLTPTTSTINGAATLTLTQNQSARILANGANYQALFLPGSGGAGTVSFAQPYATDGTLFYGPIFQVVKPLDTTWINQNGATRTTTNGSVFVSLPTTVSATDNITCRSLANASGAYTVTVGALSAFVLSSNGSAVFAMAGDSGGGRRLLNGFSSFGSSVQGFGSFIGHSTTPTTNIAVVQQVSAPIATGPFWYRIQDDGTNIFYSISHDGINFIQVFTEADTAFLPIQPANEVGFCIENLSQSLGIPFGLTVFHLSLTTP